MYENTLLNNTKFNEELPILASLFDPTGEDKLEHHQDSIIKDLEAKSDLDNIFSTTADNQTHPEAVAMNNAKSLCTGNDNDTVVGTAKAVASSDAIATAFAESISEHMFSGSAISNSDAVIEALAIGIDNTGKIDTGKGNDKVVGVANVSATAISEASSQAELIFDDVSDAEVNSQSETTANIFAEGVGINNLGKIYTGTGCDTIIGIANVSATASSTAFSLAQSVFDNNSVAIANSESLSVIEAFAVGIDNRGKIDTGKGDDAIVGIANTSTMTEADAAAFTESVATLSEFDGDVVARIGTAISQSTSLAIADSLTTTLGIINSGKICTARGNDVIFGLANNENLSNSQAISEAVATANDSADAMGDASALAIANGNAVGIANLGKIDTGKGHDTIIGVAVNNSVADANADSLAEAFADDSDSPVTTDSIADSGEAIAIGIDNADGVIKTGHDNDRIIGYGKVGIVGGKIHTGEGDDRVIGYGMTVGVEGGTIDLGKGNDYFKADIVDFDPLTEKVSQIDDRSSSIKDAAVIGDCGNDTFEIGGFEGTVSVDGGSDRDVLKLWGNVDDYKFTLGSSGNQLTVEDSDAKLVVKNVEELYFSDSDHAYSFNDFA